jgi:1,5-anhydro-D-fructose reductase (1,5-anhydro-D-mannitol-forming)
VLRTANGEETLHIEHENLYVRSVRLFSAAATGHGSPAATGEDGLKSLSVALATSEAARSGRETPVDLTV